MALFLIFFPSIKGRRETPWRIIDGEDFRGHGEHSGNGESAFFADAQVKGISRFEPIEADGVKAFGDALLDFCFRQIEISGAEGDIVKDGGAEQLVVGGLEDETDLLSNGFEILFFDV